MRKAVLLVTCICALGMLATAQQDSVSTAPAKKKFGDIIGGDGIYLRDSIWKIGGYAGITLSQIALYQWSSGGTNNFAFLATGNFYANYKKGKLIWDNNLDMNYGMVANGLIRKSALARQNFRKNADVLKFNSNIGYVITDHLYAAFKADFQSQFTRTYDYALTDTSNGRFRRYSVSKFAAPAILTLGPGLTWKPVEYFTLFFSPAKGKLTFVTPDNPGRDTTTAADGTFNNAHYTDIDETRFGLQSGKQFMGEFGAELDLMFQKDIIKNVNWKSHLNLFSAYVNANYNTQMPGYNAALDSVTTITIPASTKFIPVVRWDNDIVMKINKFLSATFSLKMIYQYNALAPIDKKDNNTGAKGADGITDADKNGNTVLGYNRLQLFEQFGVGLSLKF